MDLEQWFAHEPSVAELAEGTETDWLDHLTIEVASGKLAVVDPAQFPIGAVVAAGLRPDAYEVAVKVLARGRARPIARMRALRTGITSPARGGELGRVSVEARVGICDYELVAEATDVLPEERQQAAVASAGERGTATFDRAPVPLVAVPAGSFVVFELLHGDRRVGVEVVLV